MKRKIIVCIYIVLMLGCGWLFFDYIFWYNSGNNHFKKMDYEAAIEAYGSALKAKPPNGKECPIRINMALAMIENLGDDYDEPDNIEDSIETLKAARDVLLEEDCATKKGDGHNETAEQLKEEIEKLIEELENKDDDTGNSGSGDEEDDKPQNEEDKLEQSIKEELQRIQSNAYQERQEQLQFTEEFDMEINFDYETPIW